MATDNRRGVHRINRRLFSLSVKSRKKWVSVSISHHHLSHRLRTSRPFHLLSHFYPSCNHRDHCCLKRGFLPDWCGGVKWGCSMYVCTKITQLNLETSPPPLLNSHCYKSSFRRGHVLYLSTDAKNNSMRMPIKSCACHNRPLRKGSFNFSLTICSIMHGECRLQTRFVVDVAQCIHCCLDVSLALYSSVHKAVSYIHPSM